jgi:alpha-galactosidase
MAKITIIGAGSIIFTRNLCSDILLSPALRDCTIALMDIDSERLAGAKAVVEALVRGRDLPARVEATMDRRTALRDADYVITTFQQGGLDAYQLDIAIPQRYGVEQCVGDTLGPGGVFRALRTIPVLLEICRELDELAPDALLLNYVNPMAANCWAIDRLAGRSHVGLCHSVQGTAELLAGWLGVPSAELRYRCAGINHQAFYLSLRHGERDLYPALREAVGREELRGLEPVRIELMERFGFFVTESSGHASEYLPYFRKSAAMVEGELSPRFARHPHSAWFDYGRSGGYLRSCLAKAASYEQEFGALAAGERPLPTRRTHEYGSCIIEAIEGGAPISINGNVPNRGLISNLPAGCCVEVPCLVDVNGIQPTVVGALPPQLAALNRTNINVQELIVEAVTTKSAEAVRHAVMLDPLTAAVCSLAQIDAMVTELLDAQARWLPELRS